MAQSTSRGIGILAAVLGIVMIGGGVSKLAGESHQVAMLAQIGLPSGFLALVGTIMVGALWAHAAKGEWAELIPVSVLLAPFLPVFQRNRSRAIRLLGGA